MKQHTFKILILVMTSAILLLSGCGKKTGNLSTDSQNDVEASSAETDTSKLEEKDSTKVIIATSGSPAPYLYTDDNGNLEGYDIAVMNEVFSRLPQYEIEYELTEFQSIFTGLDAGYYQIGLNHMGYSHDRAEKYIFSDMYGSDQYGILVRDDYDEIQSVDDFAGHKTEVTAASKNALIFEGYNEKHPDGQITLDYTDDSTTTPKNVSEGTIDFEFFQIITLKSQIEALGADNLKIIPVSNEDAQSLTGGPIGNFILFPKGYEQLAEDFNAALRKAVEDGTIQKLREEYLNVEEGDILTIDNLDSARKFIENDIAKTE